MCKIVYLTSKRFDRSSNKFVNLLKGELESKGIQVVFDYSYDFFNQFRKHKTYGISIAIDFFNDSGHGRGVTLNKNCSNFSRGFAYNLSSTIDSYVNPNIKWRDIKFVKSNDKQWYKFFNEVSSETKVIFYLCTKNNVLEYNEYLCSLDKIVKAFSDEIVRCLRSDYNLTQYQKQVALSRKKLTYDRNGVGKK